MTRFETLYDVLSCDFDKEQFCFLKQRDMATRFSETWESHKWSGQIDSCTTESDDIQWFRKCNMTQYSDCIESIHVSLLEKGESNAEGSDLNKISPEQRLKYDTLNEEISCLMDFCPWTPEIDLKSKSIYSPHYVKLSIKN